MFTVRSQMRKQQRQPEKFIKFEVLTLRLNVEETQRWKVIFARARKRNHLADKSTMQRELMELENGELLTQEEKDYFRGHIASLAEKPNDSVDLLSIRPMVATNTPKQQVVKAEWSSLSEQPELDSTGEKETKTG